MTNKDDTLPEIPWLTREEIIERDWREMNSTGFDFPVEVEWDDGTRDVWEVQIYESSGDPAVDFVKAEARARQAFYRVADEIVAIRPAPDKETPPPKPWEAAGISRAAWYRRQKAAKAQPAPAPRRLKAKA